MSDTKARTVSKMLTTSTATLYTVPPRYISDVRSILIANELPHSVAVSLSRYDAIEDTYHTLLNAVEIKGNSVIQISQTPLYLQIDELIRGSCDYNSAVTVTFAVEETRSFARG